LAGCGGGSGGAAGTLSVAVTDAPVDDASDVVVEISGVEVHGAGATSSFDFAPRPVHLLALAGGASEALLDQVTLPAGHYDWLRLKVNAANSYVVASAGGTFPIRIPSGAQSGLKVVRGFTVPAGGSADFTIDFDLRRSLVDTHGAAYTLKPVLRMVDNVQAGTVAGNVDLGHYGCAAGGNAVYVYAGRDVAPTDINTTLAGSGPVLVAPVTGPDGGGNYGYRAAFLTAGDYTVALTCQVEQDHPETTEAIAFLDQYNVTVTAGQETTQGFPTP
jgi:hypothetical protein